MTFSIDNPRGGCNNRPLGKYVWEKPSGEHGLNMKLDWPKIQIKQVVCAMFNICRYFICTWVEMSQVVFDTRALMYWNKYIIIYNMNNNVKLVIYRKKKHEHNKLNKGTIWVKYRQLWIENMNIMNKIRT